MNYSYKGIGELTASFAVKNGETLIEGTAVKLSAPGEVSACASGDRIVGIVRACRGGCAAVQLRGAAEVKCSGTAPAAGYAALTADGDGGICAGGSVDYLVLDSQDGCAVIML